MANNAYLDTICTPYGFRCLETRRFTAYCTRLLFLPGLTGCSAESGIIVFRSLMLCPLNSNRVKDGVIVCEIGIRVRDAELVTTVFSKFSSAFNRKLL